MVSVPKKQGVFLLKVGTIPPKVLNGAVFVGIEITLQLSVTKIPFLKLLKGGGKDVRT